MHRLDIVNGLVFVNRPNLVAQRSGKAGRIGGRAGDDCQLVIGVLGFRQKGLRSYRFIESRAAHVANHPDDRNPWIPRIKRAIDKSLTYRILTGKEAPRERVIDDDNRSSSLHIAAI